MKTKVGNSPAVHADKGADKIADFVFRLFIDIARKRTCIISANTICVFICALSAGSAGEKITLIYFPQTYADYAENPQRSSGE